MLVIVAVSVVRRRTFADPMDTVVYGAAAGLGFAAYENLAYLVQHPDIWRSLAALRSVLTVPFHGALGIIAGAYLAIARAGTALGANRHHRDWARISSYFLVLAGADRAACGLRFSAADAAERADLDATTRMMLGAGQRADRLHARSRFAVRLVLRVGRHHAPRTDVARERLSQLRRMWALLVFGGGAGFAGLVFVLGAVRRWLIESRPQPGAGGGLGRPDLDPDRDCAAGRDHGGLLSRPQPDARLLRRLFVGFRPRLTNRNSSTPAWPLYVLAYSSLSVAASGDFQ